MKHFTSLIICAVITILFQFRASSVSQDKTNIELTAQGILARVDRIMDYQQGTMKGTIQHVYPDGRAVNIRLTGHIKQDDFLFIFSSRDRGEQLKVLYNLGGEDVWVYNIHAIKLFHKLGIDKYDLLLGTNYSFIDLSNVDFQGNYTASIAGEAIIRGKDAYRLVLNPIFKGGEYGLLTLYVAKDRFIPLRIDYYDRDKAIFKFLSIVKIQEKGDRIIPLRYDMMDIRKGTVSILNFSEFDPIPVTNREMFRPDKLGE